MSRDTGTEQGTDKPTLVDRLELSAYINAMADYINTCDMPTTIALQGGWGSGKTSFFYLVKQKLNVVESTEADANGQNLVKQKLNVVEGTEADANGQKADEMTRVASLPKCKIVELNTWQASMAGLDNSLTEILIRQLTEALPKTQRDGFIDKHKADLTRLAQRAAGLANDALDIPATRWLSMILDGVIKAEDAAWNTYNAITEMRNDLEIAIKDARESGEFDRLVVFVDDLDRLEPRTAVNLLEGIKNFMDCYGCVFVLALDEEVVFAGVKAKYGSAPNIDYSKRFFDKIIQVPFSMPVGSYRIESYIESLIAPKNKDGGVKKEGFGGKSAERKDALKARAHSFEDVIRELGSEANPSETNNPRSIKRYLYLQKLYKGILEGIAENEKSPITWDNNREASLLALLIIRENSKEAFNALCRPYRDSEGAGVDDSEHSELKKIVASYDSLDRIVKWRNGQGDDRKKAFDDVAKLLSSAIVETGDLVSISECMRMWAETDKWWTRFKARAMYDALRNRGYIDGDFDHGHSVTPDGEIIGLKHVRFPDGKSGVKVVYRAAQPGSTFQKKLKAWLEEDEKQEK